VIGFVLEIKSKEQHHYKTKNDNIKINNVAIVATMIEF
jgi:hypothetical protein